MKEIIYSLHLCTVIIIFNSNVEEVLNYVKATKEQKLQQILPRVRNVSLYKASAL